jgi:hypothetical protein
MQSALIAMKPVRLGTLLALSSLIAACASRTSVPRRVATPERAVPTMAVAAPSMNTSPLDSVAPAKRKLLASALVSNAFGGCWDAKRHATIHADTVAEDGTPYFAPHELPIDLNGDGVPDPVVEVDRDATSVRYELYVKRGNCSQHLGTVRVGGTILGPLGHANGLRTLEVVAMCETERPCKDIEHTELMFDGNGWKPSKHWTTPTM